MMPARSLCQRASRRSGCPHWGALLAPRCPSSLSGQRLGMIDRRHSGSSKSPSYVWNAGGLRPRHLRPSICPTRSAAPAAEPVDGARRAVLASLPLTVSVQAAKPAPTQAHTPRA